ncbi:MAG TPA: hypothetical protein VGD61_19775 [Pyrinomonadaceae bacterium]
MYIEKSSFGFPLALIKFLARLGSITSIVLLVSLFQAEALNPSEVPPRQWFALIFFPIGVVIGMIIAWWKEALGVSVTLGSLLAFYFVYGYLLSYHIGGWAFVAFASPAFLFLLHWLLHRAEQSYAVNKSVRTSHRHALATGEHRLQT